MRLHQETLTIEPNLYPAMELTTEELHDILHGRKEFFDKFYFRIVTNLTRNERKLFKAIALYRDKNVDLLSTAYMTNYTVFGANDWNVIYDASGLDKNEVDDEIKTMKKFIVAQCKAKGYTSPASLFENFTPFRLILLFMMRYYMEKGDRQKLEYICSYMAYSMFYTVFHNFFRYGVRKETMIYTVNNLSNKHKLKQLGSVDALLTYGVSKCVDSYKKRIMDATDLDCIYVVQQFKSRLTGYLREIANRYFENDAKKEAIFQSSDRLDTEEGAEFVERDSSMGNVEQLAQAYTTLFFQKPIDGEILNMVARLNQAARPELKNALQGLRSDNTQINVLKRFYESLFYLYQEYEHGKAIDVHSRKFMATMESIYKKGNSKETNLVYIKTTLDSWLEKFSQIYREANRGAKLNSYRKAIYQYFVFTVVLRR